ncbi:MAG: glycosyltransferase family 4 protein [Flavobacteriales bacterium]|nr:glycosyltransferase family 4 protein [Flavobacteriales bacterium]MCB9364766.1 glycosyltransferase family 4 protein [Flavobacteriales bacterium]
MSKKKIGIYLAAKPSSGGIFQYALCLITALNELDCKKYSIHYFIENLSWEEYIPKNGKTYYNPPSKLKRLLGRIVRRYSFNTSNKYAYFFNKSISSINTSSCDLILYPSQDNLCYQTNKPSLTAIHDLMHRYEPHFSEYQDGEYERREKHYSEICRNANGILVDSNLGKNHVEESYNVDANKVHILPFVPPFHLTKLTETNIIKKYNLNPKFIFYPAQFWEHKNHSTLINAFKIIINKGIDIQLVLVGAKKNNFNAIIKLIEKYNLTSNIIILGYVSDQELLSLYKSAIAMVFPSLIGPTNIPPMESLLLGCPLIVSNAYAMPEQVGDSALLINPKSAEDIAEKIELLYNNINLRSELILKGKVQANKWNHKKFNAKLELIISRVLQDSTLINE